MKLSKTIQAIAGSLNRHSGIYAAGRARHPALADHASPSDAADALRAAEDGEALTAALLEEHWQDPACPLWPSMLVVGFAPMLEAIRARFGKKPDFDLDQTVLLAFREALRSPAGSLQKATEEQLKTLRRGTLRKADTYAFDEHAHEVPATQPEPEEAEHVRRALDALDAKGRELVLCTLLGGESLDDYVARAHGPLGEVERRAAYERSRKARSRIVDDLRTQLSTA